MHENLKFPDLGLDMVAQLDCYPVMELRLVLRDPFNDEDFLDPLKQLSEQIQSWFWEQDPSLELGIEYGWESRPVVDLDPLFSPGTKFTDLNFSRKRKLAMQALMLAEAVDNIRLLTGKSAGDIRERLHNYASREIEDLDEEKIERVARYAECRVTVVSLDQALTDQQNQT